jgi:hypothetical protein
MAIYAQFEVDMPDDPKIAAAGDIPELVYYRAIMRCREHLTDGVIDRRVLSRWFIGIRGKIGIHLATLVAVGLLLEHADGWCIPPHVWTRRNPLKAAVEAKREAETERKRQWKGRARDVDATESRQARDGQPEPEPEPTDSQSNSQSQSQKLSSQVTQLPQNPIADDEPLVARMKSIARRYAEIRWATADQARIGSPTNFKNSEYRKALELPKCAQYARDFTDDCPIDILANALNGMNTSLRYCDEFKRDIAS